MHMEHSQACGIEGLRTLADDELIASGELDKVMTGRLLIAIMPQAHEFFMRQFESFCNDRVETVDVCSAICNALSNVFSNMFELSLLWLDDDQLKMRLLNTVMTHTSLIAVMAMEQGREKEFANQTHHAPDFKQ